MAPERDDYVLGEWFRCPECSEAHDGAFSVRQFLSIGNVSLELTCYACGFSHTSRDWRNQNLRPRIRIDRWFKQAYLTHPRCGGTMHAAAKCANCTARGHVTVDIMREERGPFPEESYASVVRLTCEDCGESYENEVTH